MIHPNLPLNVKQANEKLIRLCDWFRPCSGDVIDVVTNEREVDGNVCAEGPTDVLKEESSMLFEVKSVRNLQ
jgi:hypothetical protein